jgi:D-aspartate ligase
VAGQGEAEAKYTRLCPEQLTMPANSTGLMATPVITDNSLGVIRGFGRLGIPVVYLDSKVPSISRYSRYISQRLKCPGFRKSETEFIKVLLDFGRQLDNKMVIMPANDWDVLALSRYKKELEPFYYLPVPGYEIVHKLVNKKLFYKMLAEMKVAHPRTYFPEDTDELASMGQEIGYPYIIKPADSLSFQDAFHKKCFVVNSPQDLERAVGRLKGKNLEVMIQEIIPGEEIYEYYTYFNKESEPLAICGWDKIRHYPPQFGCGSFCRSIQRLPAIEPGIQLLKGMGYHGLAAPEVKKDSRDGQYKLLEVNARVTLQNQLVTACGVDITYIAYLDAIGQPLGDLPPPLDDVFWVDDFVDQLSCLILLARKEISVRDIARSLTVRKVHSVAAWDDLLPLIVHMYHLGIGALRLLLGKITGSR